MSESRAILRKKWLKNKQASAAGGYNIAICDSDTEVPSRMPERAWSGGRMVRSIWFWPYFCRFQSRTLSPWDSYFGGINISADRPYSVDCSTDFARSHIDVTTVDRACALVMPSISTGKMQKLGVLQTLPVGVVMRFIAT
jgi:hypothetical protein